LEIPVSGYWKSKLRFPYLKAASRLLLGMTTTSAPSERIFSHAGELHSEQSWHRLRNFAIHTLTRMNPHLGMNRTWIKVALICVNVIILIIFVQFLVVEIPLILILI